MIVFRDNNEDVSIRRDRPEDLSDFNMNGLQQILFELEEAIETVNEAIDIENTLEE